MWVGERGVNPTAESGRNVGVGDWICRESGDEHD
jgi:hypothetical protein